MRLTTKKMIKKWNIPKEVWAILLIVFSAFIVYLIPISQVLGNQEITNPEIAFQLSLFPILWAVSMIVVAGLYFTRKIWRKENKYGNGFGFFEIGEFPSLNFLKKYTAPQLTLLSFLIFGTLFLIANVTRTLGSGFTGLSVLPQQFSPTQSLVFSTLLIPMAEEVFSLAFIGLFVFILVLMAVRYNWGKTEFAGYYFGLIPIAIGLLAMIWHSTAYQNSDVALGLVFGFWFIKTLIVLATGFFLVGWVMHLLNNFFMDFSRLYSDGTVLGFTIFLLFAVLVLYLYLYVFKKRNVE